MDIKGLLKVPAVPHIDFATRCSSKAESSLVEGHTREARHQLQLVPIQSLLLLLGYWVPEIDMFSTYSSKCIVS
jgi:hypothetical protein